MQTQWEQSENTLEVRGKHPPLPLPSPPSNMKIIGFSWVHVEYSHWLHENYSPKTISHHFLPRLMEGNGSMGVYSNTP